MCLEDCVLPPLKLIGVFIADVHALGLQHSMLPLSSEDLSRCECLLSSASTRKDPELRYAYAFHLHLTTDDLCVLGSN